MLIQYDTRLYMCDGKIKIANWCSKGFWFTTREDKVIEDISWNKVQELLEINVSHTK